MKRISFLLLILLVFGVGVLHAQDSAYSVTEIPLDSMAAVTVLSPDDQTVAVYNQFQIYDAEPTPELVAVHLFAIGTGDEIGILSGYSDWVTGLSFNSDGSQIVTFHRNGDVNLWNTADQSLIKTIPLYVYGGSWVRFMPDDQSALYRAGQFVLGVLNLDSGAITRQFGHEIATFGEFETYTTFPAQGDIVTAGVAVSPDGQWLAASTANDAVYLQNIDSGERYPVRGNSDKPMQFAIRLFAFSSDGQRLTYFDQNDGQMHVWDVTSREEAATYALGAPSFAVSPDGSTLAWADRPTQTIYIAELADGAEPNAVLALPEGLSVAPNITSLAFTSDGSRLVVGGLFNSDGTTNVYVIDLASG